MKKLFILLCFLILHNTAKSQILIVDSLFGTNGRYIPSFPFTEDPSKSIIQPDGKIIVGGISAGFNNEHYTAITRFDICGLPDISFGDSGKVLHSFAFRNIPNDLLLQMDEKIVCAGVSAGSNAGSGHIPFISRYFDDGTPDTTFGTAGFVSQRFDPVSSGGFYSVEEYPDGRLLAIGRSTFNINGGSLGYGAMRFMQNGSLDPTFNGDGIAKYTQNGFSLGETRGILQDDGRIIIAFNNVANGTFVESISTSALDSTGALDTAYGTGGIFLDTSLTTGSVWITELPNGNTVIAATVAGNNSLDVICLTPQGTLVPSFGTGGRLRYDFPAATGEVKGIRLIDSTHLMVFGKYNQASGMGFLLSVNTIGTVNSPFGLSGFLAVDIFAGTHFIEDVQILSNGQLLCVFNTGSDFMITRLINISNVPHITQNGIFLETSGGYFLQWYFNTLIIPGATTSVYTPNTNGVYTVIATDSVGCSYQSDPFILQNVGIDDAIKNEIGFIITNPVADQLTVSVTNGLIMELRLFDMEGRLVMVQPVNAKYFSAKHSVAKGTYLLKVITGSGTLTRKISIL